MKNIKEQFPIFQNHKDLVYLDSAATTQKPKSVLDALTNFYTTNNANIHRGVYQLSQQATQAYEQARTSVADFLHANNVNEIVFTKGATEAINLVAHGIKKQLQPGDEILLTEMEHHANLVPWQQVAKETGATLKFIPVDTNGNLDLSNLDSLLTEKTKFFSFVHISNSLGTINPVKELISQARAKSPNAQILIDGCQAVAHTKVDVQELDADFYVFSGHKLYGPTGIGALYGKEDLLNKLDVYQTGGDMILSVTKEESTFQQAPAKFEAGTPPIAQAIGLAESIKFIQSIGFETIEKQEQALLAYAIEQLKNIEEIQLITPKNQAGILSFNLEGIHPHDVGTLLDEQGIAIRTGHHCTQPVMHALSLTATNRASFGVYNTKEDVDALEKGLKQVMQTMKA